MKTVRYSWLPVLLGCILPGFLLFSGCETEKEVIRTVEVVVRDTVKVEIVSVDSIFASPDSINQGGSIRLTAQVQAGSEAGNLTFYWFATEGHFDVNQGDTVTWTAPDDPGSYMVSIHATDGDFIGVGSRFVGVGMYVPSVSPFYLGDVNCAACHADKHSEWEETGHAHAWQTLQESGHPQSFCIPCHAVGFEGPAGNGGYDEAPIQLFVNVQCENCHTAGSAHVAGMDPSLITIDYSAQQCGTCHDGTHHPFLTEWSQSPHAFDPEEAGSPASRATCQGCHEGVAAAIRLSGDLSSFYGSGAIAGRPLVEDVALQPVACVTCHDPHNDDNPGQLRTVADVPLVTANGASPVITAGGVGKLCMHCHHARRGPEDQIQNGSGHPGPHANPQADMLLGASAFHGVADPGFVWAGPSHLYVQNSCKTCHLPTAEFGATGQGEPAKTGHTFLPKVEACQGCHGAINSFDDIMALEDFDGDGSIEGIQSEVRGLLDVLEGALYSSFVSRGVDTTGLSLESALGDTLISNRLERESGYNWLFIEEDKSHGVHNPDYAVQLLQQSYQHLTGTAVPNSVVVEGDNVVTAPQILATAMASH